MKTDLRFNLQHAGDVFVDAVQKTADTAAEFSKSVIDNCDPDSLHNKKKKLSSAIINRVSGLTKRERFIHTVQKAADSAIVITKKVIHAYDLNALHSKKKKISDEIIERVSAQVKESTGAVSHDAALSRLVARLNGVEKELAGYKKQKTARVGPVTSMITKLGKALFSAKK